jgi:hypothetical protein
MSDQDISPTCYNMAKSEVAEIRKLARNNYNRSITNFRC